MTGTPQSAKDSFDAAANSAQQEAAAREPYTIKDLLSAIEKKDKGLTAAILASQQVHIEAAGEGGWTPLYRAIATGEPDFVTQVLAAGAKADIKASYVDHDSHTPLTFSIHYYRSTPAIVALLLDAGVDVKSPSHADHGKTPLELAVKLGDERTVEVLIQKGADPNTPVWYGETVVHLAAQEGHGEIIRILKRYGADLDKQGEFMSTPLNKALSHRHREAFEVLIDEGANVSPCNDNRSTLLMTAAICSETGVIDFLVEKGYDVNYQNGEGKTALYYAANAGRGASVRRLLDLGADPNIKANDGETPRQAAERQGHKQVSSLIDQKLAAEMKAGTSVAIKPAKPFRITLGAKNG